MDIARTNKENNAGHNISKWLSKLKSLYSYNWRISEDTNNLRYNQARAALNYYTIL